MDVCTHAKVQQWDEHNRQVDPQIIPEYCYKDVNITSDWVLANQSAPTGGVIRRIAQLFGCYQPQG